MRLNGYNIINAVFEPTYKYLFVVSDNGKIQKFNIADIDTGEQDDDEVDEGPAVKDIPSNYTDIHSFIHAHKHNGLNISIDGTSSMCSVVSHSGQLKVLDLNTHAEKFSYYEPGVEYTSVLALKGLAIIGDSKGYLRVLD